MQALIYLSLLILAISIVFGIFGRGGGSFRLPAIITFLTIPFYTAAGVSAFLVLIQGVSMLYIYGTKYKLVDWKLAFTLALVVTSMSFLGGFVSLTISPLILKILFAVVILISSYFIGKAENIAAKKGKIGVWHREFAGSSYNVNVLYILPLIALAAFIAGSVGISGSSLITPICILLGAVPLRVAIGNSSLLVVASGLGGFLGHALRGGVDWQLCLILGLVTVIGSQIGSRLHLRLNARYIRLGYAILLVVSAIWMVIKIFV